MIIIPVYFSAIQAPSEKVSTLYTLILIRVDPFSEWDKTNFDRIISPVSVLTLSPLAATFVVRWQPLQKKLDPGQNVGPDLDLNCLTLWWFSWKIFLEKS